MAASRTWQGSKANFVPSTNYKSPEVFSETNTFGLHYLICVTCLCAGNDKLSKIKLWEFLYLNIWSLTVLWLCVLHSGYAPRAPLTWSHLEQHDLCCPTWTEHRSRAAIYFLGETDYLQLNEWFNHRAHLTDTGVWLGGTQPPTLRVATLQTDLSHQKHAKQRSWCKSWLLPIRRGFIVVLLCLKISGKGNLAALCSWLRCAACNLTEQKAEWNQLALYGVATTALWPHNSNTQRHSSKRHQETLLEWFHFFYQKFISSERNSTETFNRGKLEVTRQDVCGVSCFFSLLSLFPLPVLRRSYFTPSSKHNV